MVKWRAGISHIRKVITETMPKLSLNTPYYGIHYSPSHCPICNHAGHLPLACMAHRYAWHSGIHGTSACMAHRHAWHIWGCEDVAQDSPVCPSAALWMAPGNGGLSDRAVPLEYLLSKVCDWRSNIFGVRVVSVANSASLMGPVRMGVMGP